MNQSYWENYLLPKNIDILIVGSGIVGMTCAIQAKIQNPKLCITILERGTKPFGATTKNAGFACFGSVSEILDDLSTMDSNQVLELIKQRWDGLQLLQEIVKGHDIGIENNGGYEIFTNELAELFHNCEENIPKINKMLKNLFRKDVFKVQNGLIKEFGFNGVQQIISNPFESQLHPSKMTNALMHIVNKLGIIQLFGATLTEWTEKTNEIQIEVNNQFELTSKKMIFATNGFTSNLIPRLDVKPTRAQVLITKPIHNLKIKGSFHLDRGYYYFRNIDQRVLFGGARQLDFKTEYTANPGTTAIIQNDLEYKLSSIILPGVEHQVDQRWSGVMGTGPVKSPIVENISEKIIVAVRLGGMGVALGSLVGKKAAHLAIL